MSDWRTVALKDVTVDVKSWDPSPEPEFTYVDISSIDNERCAIVDAKRLPGVKAPSRARRPIRDGDVLFSNVRTYLRNVAQVQDIQTPAVASTGFTLLRPTSELDSRFLFHLARSDFFIDRVTPEQTGTQYPATSDRVVRGLEIALPHIVEQRFIANVVDRLESTRRSADSHIDAARRAVDRLRQAVLTAACSGRLTADWRNSSNPGTAASCLLTTDRRSRVMPADGWISDIPDTWKVVSLDQLTSLITSGSRGWAKYYADEGALFIRAQNINKDWLDLTDMAHVQPPHKAEGERTRVQIDDLLVTITGANVTKSARVNQKIDDAYVNQHVALARPLVPEMSQYLHLWLISPAHGRAKLENDAYGAGKPGLNLHNLRSTPVGLPPLSEQVEIVRRVYQILSLADALAARIDAASKCVARSSQAVLAKAFRGELITPGAAT